MKNSLYPHQLKALDQLKTGSILRGGVGSGKSKVALYYYYEKECEGEISENLVSCPMRKPKDLYIITTAKKRDTFEWELECADLLLSKVGNKSLCGVSYTVDSWNRIKKYSNVENAFFIFDEQRLVGSGAWVRTFLKIVKKNNWILLTATPADTWMDYIPVFVANGFYKNRSEFIRQHVVYNTFTNYPKVDRFVEEGKLRRFRKLITVEMPYEKPTISHWHNVVTNYDEEKMETVIKKRWNPYENRPIKQAGEYYYVMRKVVNSDYSRMLALADIIWKFRKVIVFYNFDYELEILRTINNEVPSAVVAEYNGHKHEHIPSSEQWVYLVQYNSGSEGWNCIETNALVFYSQNYSYRMTVQAAGRIDRLNTPFTNLYYYRFVSKAKIDSDISKAFLNKKDFNELPFHRI